MPEYAIAHATRPPPHCKELNASEMRYSRKADAVEALVYLREQLEKEGHYVIGSARTYYTTSYFGRRFYLFVYNMDLGR